MISYKERLHPVTTFIFDIDGVLTNGEIGFVQGSVLRMLHSRDGYAMQYASRKGYRLLVISGAHCPDIKARLERIGVAEVRLGSYNKLAVYKELKEIHGFSDEQVMYMGDDIPDIPLLRVVGISACPQDAVQEVKAISHYQSRHEGGKGCVRDMIEQVMRVQGKWLDGDDAYFW